MHGFGFFGFRTCDATSYSTQWSGASTISKQRPSLNRDSCQLAVANAPLPPGAGTAQLEARPLKWNQSKCRCERKGPFFSAIMRLCKKKRRRRKKSYVYPLMISTPHLIISKRLFCHHKYSTHERKPLIESLRAVRRTPLHCVPLSGERRSKSHLISVNMYFYIYIFFFFRS